MRYEPLTIKLSGRQITPARERSRRELLFRCPSLEFYLRPLLNAYNASDEAKANDIIAKWVSTAPRPVQRIEALAEGDDDGPDNLILFGRKSGTSKTTVAFEKIWRNCTTRTGFVSCSDKPPLAFTGHQFARRVAANARDLDELMDEFIAADILLLDDLDKRGDSSGKFSPIVQQTLLDLIEARTTRDYKSTILTMNTDGSELEAKFDDDIGPFILRRLRQRFRAIDFDPEEEATSSEAQSTPANVVPMEAAQ